jgi:hypothetical protein
MGARDMTQDVHSSSGGPGISASCSRLFAKSGMRVGIAARNPDKPVLENLETTHGVRRYACDASEPAAVELLFHDVARDLGAPTLVVHNIDGRVAGIFRKGITEADPSMAYCAKTPPTQIHSGIEGLIARRGDSARLLWDGVAGLASAAMPLPIQFLLFMLVGWVSRQQHDVIEYLKAENRALREHLGGKRLRFTNAQRRLCVLNIRPR